MHKGSKGIIVYLKVRAEYIYVAAMGVPKKKKDKVKFRKPSILMVL
jgi:hypothetical protein